MQTLNESYLQPSAPEAMKGLMMLNLTILFSGMVLHRFGNSLHEKNRKKEDRNITGPWWVGFSPFEKLCAYARSRNLPLSLAARQCLAIDWEWSRVDLLIKVQLRQPLSAWSGTPKTQVPRPETQKLELNVTPNRATEQSLRPKTPQQVTPHWEPDRDITQIYIPGLHEADPMNPNQQIWQGALLEQSRLLLPPN